MFEPISIAVMGRGRLAAEAHTDAEGVAIRLDDASRDEFWAVVRLSKAQLLTLLAQVEAQEDEVDAVYEPAGV